MDSSGAADKVLSLLSCPSVSASTLSGQRADNVVYCNVIYCTVLTASVRTAWHNTNTTQHERREHTWRRDVSGYDMRYAFAIGALHEMEYQQRGVQRSSGRYRGHRLVDPLLWLDSPTPSDLSLSSAPHSINSIADWSFPLADNNRTAHWTCSVPFRSVLYSYCMSFSYATGEDRGQVALQSLLRSAGLTIVRSTRASSSCSSWICALDSCPVVDAIVPCHVSTHTHWPVLVLLQLLYCTIIRSMIGRGIRRTIFVYTYVCFAALLSTKPTNIVESCI